MKDDIFVELRRAIEKAQRSGLTRSRLGQMAGVHRCQVGRIASGGALPTLAVADRLAKALGFRLSLVPRDGK